MSYVKKIVCLANSRKNFGRCVAGKEAISSGYGPWIRPISSRPSAEVSHQERSFENGQDLRVLDIIEIPMIGATPSLHQSENHVIDATSYWVKSGELPWGELETLVEKPSGLWPNGDSSYNGKNDRVKLEIASRLTNSLTLIEPETLTVVVQPEWGNKRRVRAHFRYQNMNYVLPVTDPVASQYFLAKPDGEYPLTDAYLCVSLGEAFTDGCCYKIVAAIISRQPLQDR